MNVEGNENKSSNITIRQMPNNIATGRVDLKADRFETIISQKGKDVTWESAIKCPCKSDGRGNLSTCVNCGGLGWVFINPIKTKMVIQSMNMTSKYSSWSLEKVGMANITSRYADVVSDMDRITLDESTSKLSQVVYPKLFGDTLFAFINYPVLQIIEIFLYVGANVILHKLTDKDYWMENNKVMFRKELYQDGMTVSIRYTHRVQYFVVDITREARQSTIQSPTGDQISSFPLSFIGRRCHYVINPDNFTGAAVSDNSYQTVAKKPYNVTD